MTGENRKIYAWEKNKASCNAALDFPALPRHPPLVEVNSHSAQRRGWLKMEPLGSGRENAGRLGLPDCDQEKSQWAAPASADSSRKETSSSFKVFCLM